MLQKPQTHFVPPLSLPQMLQSQHLERHMAQVEVRQALSCRGSTPDQGRGPSPSPRAAVAAEIVRSPSPHSARSRFTPAQLFATRSASPSAAEPMASGAEGVHTVAGTHRTSGRATLTTPRASRHAVLSRPSRVSVFSHSSGRSAAVAEAEATLGFSVLAAKNKEHARLRWPRMQQLMGDVGGEALAWETSEKASGAVAPTASPMRPPAVPLSDRDATAPGSFLAITVPAQVSRLGAGLGSTVVPSPPMSRRDRRKQRPVSKSSKDVVQRPAVMPRASARATPVAGIVSTTHSATAGDGTGDGGGVAAQHSGQRRSPLQRRDSSSSSGDISPRTSAVLESSEIAPALKRLDRKWFLRVAPISCLHSVASARVAHKKLSEEAGVARSSSLRPEVVTTTDPAVGGEYLNFESWGLNDDYLESVMSAHARSSDNGLRDVKYINLSNNQITQAGITRLLANCSPEGVLSLSLASNRLHQRGPASATEAISKCKHLQELDLSDNKMSDAFLESLCSLINGHCLELRGLALAKCGIGTTTRCASALGGLVGAGRLLTSLDLAWNMLSGEAALLVVTAIGDNGATAGGQLRRVNLAWNRLGTATQAGLENRRRQATMVAKAFADVFTFNKTLFHLDLSYNNFSADDCRIMGEALRANHTLFGIHLIGNQAAVDSMGFIVPLSRGGSFEMEGGGRICTAEMPEIAGIDNPQDEDPSPTKRNVIGQASPQGSPSRARANAPPPNEGHWTGDNMQLSMNALMNAVPPKFQINHPLELMNRSKGVVAPKDGAVVRQNPALLSLTARSVAPFSEDDLQRERNYTIARSRVQTIAGDVESVQVNAKCCWICENWVEHRLFFDPTDALSEEEQAEIGIVETVYAFYSIDAFTRPIVLSLHQTNATKIIPVAGGEIGSHLAKRGSSKTSRKSIVKTTRYIGSRMLPRTMEPIHVVFVVNGKPLASARLAKVRLSIAKVLSPIRDLPMLETAQAFEIVNVVRVAGAGHRPGASGVFEEAEAWVVPNSIAVIEDPTQMGTFSCVPRSWESKRKDAEYAWSLETSIFRDFACDLDSLAEDCFEVDWQCSRLGHLVRTEEAWQELLKVLPGAYMQIMLAFWWEAYGTLEMHETVAGVSMGGFRKIMVRRGGEGRGQLLDGLNLNGNDCDCVFVAANVVDRDRRGDFPFLPQRAMARFQFLEAIVRVAFRRFVGAVGGRAGERDKNLPPAAYRQAIESFLKMTELGADILRLRRELHEEVFTESCCLMLEGYKSMLRMIFDHYRSLKVFPSDKKQNKTLHFRQWVQFLRDAQVIAGDFAVADAGHCFALAREMRSDEISSTGHMELNWTEFLIGICAVVKILNGSDEQVLGISFSDLVDDFCVTHLQEAYLVVAKGQKHVESEFQGLAELVERVFAGINSNGSHGTVSLRRFKSACENPAIRMEMTKCRLTLAEVCVVYNITWRQLKEQQRWAVFFTDEVTLAELISCFMKLKDSFRGFDRAIAFIERSFDEFDEDSSGSLDRKEFQNLVEEPTLIRKLQSVGFDTSTFGQVFEVLDEEGVGHVTMEQVAEGFLCFRDAAFAARRAVKVLLKFYQSSCGSKRGNLNKELVSALFDVPPLIEKLTSLHMAVPDWSTMFEELDVDGSGDLDWEEIREGMYTFWLSRWESPAAEARAKSRR